VQRVRTYGGLLPQERRDQRREQLLEAALDLAGTEGVAALTMRQVIARARLAPRYFYENFAGVEELWIALYDRLNDELLGAALAVVQQPVDPSPRAVTEAALAAMVDVLADDPRKGRVLSESAGMPELAARRAQLANHATGLLVAQAARRLEGKVDVRAVGFVARFLVAGFAESVAQWIEHPDEVTREQVVHNCTDLFLAAGTTLDRLV
jgi:AcrR family transcriptional regulator